MFFYKKEHPTELTTSLPKNISRLAFQIRPYTSVKQRQKVLF